jgi:hypothetical protein
LVLLHEMLLSQFWNKKKIVSLRWIDIPWYRALYRLSVGAYMPLTAHYTGGGGGGDDDDDDDDDGGGR